MKVLIGYDGSPSADAALDDLQRAGLPADVEAVILMIAEVWLPPPMRDDSPENCPPDGSPEQVKKRCDPAKKAVTEAETLSRYAKDRLQSIFPGWKITSVAACGSPSRGILAKADDFKPDLIVVGSQGRTAVSRILLGSISQKILTEAHCSVGVARGRIEAAPKRTCILIGFDGLSGSMVAVEAVASRFWLENSEVRLLAVSDPITPSLIGRFVPPIADSVEEVNEGERERLQELAEPALQKLKDAGLCAALSIVAGNPKQVLVEEAARWHADAIFVGANAAGSRLERFLLGSVSAAVAARANCSVEVVRKQSAD